MTTVVKGRIFKSKINKKVKQFVRSNSNDESNDESQSCLSAVLTYFFNFVTVRFLLLSSSPRVRIFLFTGK